MDPISPRVSQSESHGLSNQTPGCGTSPVTRLPFCLTRGPRKKLQSPQLPGLCNPSWLSSGCSWLYHWCPRETTAVDNSQWPLRGYSSASNRTSVFPRAGSTYCLL